MCKALGMRRRRMDSEKSSIGTNGNLRPRQVTNGRRSENPSQPCAHPILHGFVEMLHSYSYTSSSPGSQRVTRINRLGGVCHVNGESEDEGLSILRA